MDGDWLVEFGWDDDDDDDMVSIRSVTQCIVCMYLVQKIIRICFLFGIKPEVGVVCTGSKKKKEESFLGKPWASSCWSLEPNIKIKTSHSRNFFPP